MIPALKVKHVLVAHNLLNQEKFERAKYLG